MFLQVILSCCARNPSASSYYFRSIQAKYGSHCTCAYGYGILHGLGSETYQWRGLGQAQDTTGNQCRVFAQRVPSYISGGNANFSHPHAVSRYTCHQHDRLGVGGQCQFFFGAFLDQSTHILTQGIRSFQHGLHHHRVITPSIQHANGLRALAWKYKSEWLQ